LRFRVLVVCIGIVVLLAACGGAPAAPPPDAGTDEPVVQATDERVQATADTAISAAADTATSTPTAAASVNAAPGTGAQDVLATVNGDVITRSAFNEALQRRSAEFDQIADPAALETTVLTELINQRLVAQAAAQMDITVTDAELDAEIANLQDILEGDADAWTAWLEQNNYTESQLRADLRAQLTATRVRDAVVGDAAAQDTRQVQARHILVGTEQEAAEIRARLVAGENFVELAATYSRDVTTRDQGGDLGWFTAEGLLEPRVAEVAFSQPEGAISAPVATRLGWHIVETLAFDDLPLPPEKQAEVAQVVFDEWLTTLYDSAMIEINR
jgi:parvulin-like peptidyl-prolyl isomerase